MSAPSYEQIYDIETPIEEATASFLRNAGFFAVTRLNANEDFQKQRPRVEIRALLGGPTPQAHVRLIPATFEQHIDIFRFTLHIQCVTELRAADTNNQMPIYRARIRRQTADISKTFIDDTLLPYHAVCRCWAAGTEYLLNQEEGLEYSTLNYEGDVMVRPSAWPESTDTEPGAILIGGGEGALLI